MASHSDKILRNRRSRAIQGDARELAKRLPDRSIDVTITSPPYFDMKDYGVRQQIGYGQTYATYLDDLKKVFSEIHRATRVGGSLWIVIDTLRRDNEVVLLPFDVAAKLKAVGWVLRDVIIWRKERTVPWVGGGKSRRIFEYILVFSKTKGAFRYFAKTQRDVENIRRWWVKYPERYHPAGKSLDEVWEYDIPVQGSWGRKYVRHFCPLPPKLVARIIDLTTRHGYTVLDPFAGSGAVLTQAALMGRRYLGFELNRRYLRKFKTYLKEQRATIGSLEVDKTKKVSRAKFARLVVKLRIVKYARVLYRLLREEAPRNNIICIAIRADGKATNGSRKLVRARVSILVGSERSRHKIESSVRTVCGRPPLSKFGVEHDVNVTSSQSAFVRALGGRAVYTYSATNSHAYVSRTTARQALEVGSRVISTIGLKVKNPYD